MSAAAAAAAASGTFPFPFTLAIISLAAAAALAVPVGRDVGGRAAALSTPALHLFLFLRREEDFARVIRARIERVDLAAGSASAAHLKEVLVCAAERSGAYVAVRIVFFFLGVDEAKHRHPKFLLHHVQ